MWSNEPDSFFYAEREKKDASNVVTWGSRSAALAREQEKATAKKKAEAAESGGSTEEARPRHSRGAAGCPVCAPYSCVQALHDEKVLVELDADSQFHVTRCGDKVMHPPPQ